MKITGLQMTQTTSPSTALPLSLSQIATRKVVKSQNASKIAK
jgi:hypothetical protein